MREPCGCSYVDYAGDNDNWKIVTGYAAPINGLIIEFLTKSQKPLDYKLQIFNIHQSWSYVGVFLNESCCRIPYYRAC